MLKTKTTKNTINESQARKGLIARITRYFWFALFLSKQVENATLPQWIEGDLWEWERLGEAAFIFEILTRPGQYQGWA